MTPGQPSAIITSHTSWLSLVLGTNVWTTLDPCERFVTYPPRRRRRQRATVETGDNKVAQLRPLPASMSSCPQSTALLSTTRLRYLYRVAAEGTDETTL
jgi:hypothetical protein